MVDYPSYKVRASKRGSRPRTKVRPDYSDLPVGWVLGIDRGRFRVLIEDQAAEERIITAMRARALGKFSLVVGDRVRLQGDLSGEKDTLARIVELLPRRNYLKRSSDDIDGVERDIVANLDQVLIVSSLVSPPARIGMIDRCLVAAFHAEIDAMICFTKHDLGDDPQTRDYFDRLDQPYIVTSIMDDDDSEITHLDRVHDYLSAKKTVLIGHSGVGKSTIVNALVPDAKRETGDVNEVTGRGRHTSTSAVALSLPNDTGWVIDTPGVRSFGLAYLSAAQVLHAFGDLDEAATQCERGCTHMETEPTCYLDVWRQGDDFRNLRVTSFRRIIATKNSYRDGAFQ